MWPDVVLSTLVIAGLIAVLWATHHGRVSSREWHEEFEREHGYRHEEFGSTRDLIARAEEHGHKHKEEKA
jgi:hypothetical protein